MNFLDKYNDAPVWQQLRYNRLLKFFLDIELTETEKSYLLWLAGFDNETEITFSKMFEKLVTKESEINTCTKQIRVDENDLLMNYKWSPNI